MRFNSLNRTFLAGTFAAVSAFATMACDSGTSPDAKVEVRIPIGASLRTAAESLSNAGVIGNPTLFRLYAKAMGGDRSIQAGTYLLSSNMGWGDAIDALRNGKGIISRVTIPEGFSIAQMVPVLARALAVPPESIDVAVRDSALRAKLGVPTSTLEGYLFPDTYMFGPGTSARQAVAEMVKRFEREWKATDSTQLAAQLAALGRTRHEIVTMASIVEKEAKLADERPIIAGVYYNRLKIGMPLQADPTVQYAMGRHSERVLYKDLEIESPYNTYRVRGLPPGPIASPGAASLRAALQPASVSYLYFVAAPDGHHEFRNSLSEHADAVRSVRRRDSGK